MPCELYLHGSVYSPTWSTQWIACHSYLVNGGYAGIQLEGQDLWGKIVVEAGMMIMLDRQWRELCLDVSIKMSRWASDMLRWGNRCLLKVRQSQSRGVLGVTTGIWAQLWLSSFPWVPGLSIPNRCHHPSHKAVVYLLSLLGYEPKPLTRVLIRPFSKIRRLKKLTFRRKIGGLFQKIRRKI